MSIVAFFSTASIHAGDAPVSTGIDLIPYTEHLTENCAKRALSVKDLLALDHPKSADVPRSSPAHFSRGYTPCEHWYRLRLDVVAPQKGLWWLQVSPTFLDEVDIYSVAADDSVHAAHAGDHVPQSKRALQTRHFLVPLEITDDSNDYYLRVRTTSTLALGLKLWEPKAYLNYAARENMLYGMLFGLTLTAIIICLIGGGWFRQAFYFAMAAFLFFNALAHFTVNGFDRYFLYPESVIWPDRILTFSAFAAGMSGVCMYLAFLRPGEYLPRFTYFCWGVAGIGAIGALASLAGYPSPVISGLAAMVVLASMLTLSLLMLRYRFLPALLMFLLFVPQLLTLCLQIARNFGQLPMSFWTTHFWPIMSMLQIPFVALVVMLRVREQEKAYLLETEKVRVHRDLFSMVSHELRTPLAVVSSALANIELQTAESHPELAPRFSRANLGLARLNRLIDNALAEDRMLDKGIVLQRRWITVDELVAQLRELRTVEPPHSFHLELPADPLAMYVDPHWLGIALLNLLDNAVKYSPSGGHIRLSAYQENQMVVIRIVDEGMGIPADSADKIFEKFYRAPNALTLQGSSGMGLGLFLVQTVITLHGGQLEYRPNPTGGSIFTCTFLLPE